MRVYQLIDMLKELPQDATVLLDDDSYPQIEGCIVPGVHEGDPEDAPPPHVVLITTVNQVDE